MEMVTDRPLQFQKSEVEFGTRGAGPFLRRSGAHRPRKSRDGGTGRFRAGGGFYEVDGTRFPREVRPPPPLLFGVQEGSATRWREAELGCLSEYITGRRAVKEFFRLFVSFC